MKKIFNLVLAVMITMVLTLSVSAAVQGPATAKAAIEATKAMQTVKEKANYLISQAKFFYSSGKFQDVVNVSQYILSNLDKNSLDAKSLLEKAKQQIANMAQKKVNDIKANISGLGIKQ